MGSQERLLCRSDISPPDPQTQSARSFERSRISYQLGHPVFFDAAFAADFKNLAAPAETWDVPKARADQVADLEVRHTAVVRGIEDHDDYCDALRLAGLPVPESAARPEAAPVLSDAGLADNGTGTVSFGG